MATLGRAISMDEKWGGGEDGKRGRGEEGNGGKQVSR
jgi:hypothetical protein